MNMVLNRKEHYSPAEMALICPKCHEVVPIGDEYDSASHYCAAQQQQHIDVGSMRHPSLEGGAQHVIVSERDTDNPFNNGGPIAMEQMMGKSDLLSIIERAEYLGDKYGKQGIFRLVYVGTPDQCRAIIEGE